MNCFGWTMRSGGVLTVALTCAMLASGSAARAEELTAAAPVSSTPPPAFTPRPQGGETGFSTIEQRWAYATPDEGEFEFPMQVAALPMEFAIEEQSMCDGTARIKIRYSKKTNKVWVNAKFTGLPYRPSYCYEWNPSTKFNQFPDCVEQGKWQIWLVGRFFTRDVTFFYDATSLELLGSSYDFPQGPPANAIPVPIPAVQMICSPMFEPTENGVGNFSWEYDYNKMLDHVGTAGVAASFVPTNLCTPDKYITYWTNGGLPQGEAMSFDDFLKSIYAGFGINATTSLEPDPKPAYLHARDNIMIGHTGIYPQVIPDGYTMDFRGGTVVPRTSCQSHQNPPWPGPYYNLCASR